MSTATVNTRDANSKLVPIEQQQPMNPTYASQYFKALKIHQFDENQKTGSRHSRYPDSGYNYKQAIGEAKDLYWNSSGTKLAVVRSDYDIRIWNSPDRSKDIKYTTEIKGLHEHRVESVSWDPTCADVFATCADDSQGRVKIWDSKSKLSIKEFTTGAANKKCAFSPDGKFLAVLRKDNVILLFDVTDTPCKIGQLKEDIRINNFCISNDGTQLFTAFSNGCVNVYTIGSPGAHATPDNSLYEITLLTSLKGPECAAESMGFDPQGEWLAVSYEEGSVLIWSMTDYLCVRCLQKEFFPMHSISFSYDGAFLAVTYVKHSVINIYHVATGDLVHQISNQQLANFPKAEFHPTNYALAFLGDKGIVNIMMISRRMR